MYFWPRFVSSPRKLPNSHVLFNTPGNTAVTCLGTKIERATNVSVYPPAHVRCLRSNKNKFTSLV